MKLEDQVSSFAPSQRLKELGVKQESYFCWWYSIGDNNWILRESKYKRTSDIFAFTVAELGEMLPRGFSSGRPFGKELYECWPTFFAMSDDRLDAEQSKFLKVPLDQELKEADARAKMLIYLIEQGLVKP